MNVSMSLEGSLYNICKTYKPAFLKSRNCLKFFSNYQLGKCTKQAIGISKFDSQVRKVAAFLKFPDYKLGSLFRRSSVTI